MHDWYVVKVKPRTERAVGVYLGQFGVQTYAPEIAVLKKALELREPLFPGYTFILTDPASREWPIVRWAKGVSYVLPHTGPPAPLSAAFMQEVQVAVEQWNGAGWRAAFQPGDRVRVSGGPLNTLDAIFERYVPGKQRCEVLVHLIGRQSRMQLPVTYLEATGWERRFPLPTKLRVT